MLAHFAGNSGQYHVLAVVELHLKECVGLLIDNRAFGRNQIVFRQINFSWFESAMVTERLGLNPDSRVLAATNTYHQDT
jgi:hypothetical protein